MIPPFVTLAMPPSATVSGSPLGGLYVGGESTPITFTASGLDYGLDVFASQSLKNVSYQ
jgi:hypothetical protein